MTIIEKCERGLALAKELGLNDNQTKELMALILELPYFKFNLNPPVTVPATPIVPWIPNTPTWPGIGGPVYPGDTIITYGVAPGSTDFGGITLCACSPVGQPHSDSCKSGDSIFEAHKAHDH
jgi:hypothetical protein